MASRIPKLVTTYEWNTLAAANATQGNHDAADKYYRIAIDVAPNDIQKGRARRTYAMFLYSQASIEKGRSEFKKSIDAFGKEDNSAYYNKGVAYQNWGWCEREYNRSPDTAEIQFSKAADQFKMIDMKPLKEKALSDLENFRASIAGLQEAVPGTPLAAPHSPPGVESPSTARMMELLNKARS